MVESLLIYGQVYLSVVHKIRKLTDMVESLLIYVFK